MKYRLDRLMPVHRDAAVQFDLPAMRTVGHAREACASILAAVGEGRLTPSDAEQVPDLVGPSGNCAR